MSARTGEVGTLSGSNAEFEYGGFEGNVLRYVSLMLGQRSGTAERREALTSVDNAVRRIGHCGVRKALTTCERGESVHVDLMNVSTALGAATTIQSLPSAQSGSIARPTPELRSRVE